MLNQGGKKYYITSIFEMTSILFLIMFYLYTLIWFKIEITLKTFTFPFYWIMIIPILLWLIIKIQQLYFKYHGPFMMFFFWTSILIIATTLFFTLAQAYSFSDYVRDYFLESNLLKIKVVYSVAYKCYFLKEYLNLIYPNIIKTLHITDNIMLNKKYFSQVLECLDFKIVLHNGISLNQLREQCYEFMANYIDHRMKHSVLISSIEKDILWRESLTYNSLLFLRNGLLLLCLPHILYHVIPQVLFNNLPIILLHRFYPSYFVKKGTYIAKDMLQDYVVDFQMTAEELEFFYYKCGEFLLEQMGKEWIFLSTYS